MNATSVLEVDEDARRRFESDWAKAQPQPIERYLPPEDHPAYAGTLEEIIHIDLEMAWKRYGRGTDGTPHPQPVEDYVRRFPCLDGQVLVRLIRQEYEMRHMWGDSPSTAEYRVRFPKTLVDAERLFAEPPSAVLPRIAGDEVLGVLSRGGQGVVFRARQPGLNRLVALKMILSGARAQPEERQRFRHEAEAVAHLQNPHIVQIFEVGEHDGQPFFSLEFVAGGTLAQKIAARPQPARYTTQMVEKLARAMGWAHQNAIIHRDLKPANVLLTVEGEPKITDFGLAKRLHADAGQTKTGNILGTPSYMSPEQAAGKTKEVGPASDIYSLGAILYEMLTGRPPFLGENTWDTIVQVTSADPVSPRRLQPGVPRDLETICLKCLLKEPDQRYANAGELADELRRFQEGRPILTRPTPVWQWAWKWARRQPAVASLIAVSIAALVSLVLYLDQRATTAQRVLGHQQRLAERTAAASSQVQQLRVDAQVSADRGQIQEARGQLQAAFEILRAEPALRPSLEQPLESLRADVDRLEVDEHGSRTADSSYREFFRLRDAALLANGMAFTGVEHDANVKATIDHCRGALAQFGMDDVSKGEPVFSKYLSEERRRQCVAVCYELLLIRAEAETRPEAGRSGPTREQAARAIRLLDRASQLGVPTTLAYHRRRADYLEQQEDFDGARRERRLAADAPLGAFDYFLMGDENQKQKRLAQAADDFADALALQPNHFWARYFLAMCNLQSGKPAEARDNLTACLVARDDLHWLYLLRGFANGQLNQFPAAERDFDRARQLLQKQPDAQAEYGILVNWGNICVRQAQMAERALPPFISLPLTPNVEMTCRGVAEGYRQQRLAKASDSLGQAIKLKPDQYPAYRSLALVVRQQGKRDEAIRLIGVAIDAPGERPPQIQGQLYGQRARWRLERNETDAALADLNESVRIFPNAADYVERGKIRHARKRFEEALADYAEAIKVQPNETAAYRLKADALMFLEQYEAAARSLDDYLARNGRPTAEVFRTRARAQAQLRQLPLALADYKLALNLQPDSATYADRGLVQLSSGNFEAAERDFRAALELNPTNANAYAGRALVRARQGKHREALADVKLSREYAPDDAPLLWEAAHVYAQLAADAALPNSRPLRSRASYQEEGVELLWQALERVKKDERKKFWQDRIEMNSLLNPLRGSPAFDRLEREWLLGRKFF